MREYIAARFANKAGSWAWRAWIAAAQVADAGSAAQTVYSPATSTSLAPAVTVTRPTLRLSAPSWLATTSVVVAPAQLTSLTRSTPGSRSSRRG